MPYLCVYVFKLYNIMSDIELLDLGIVFVVSRFRPIRAHTRGAERYLYFYLASNLMIGTFLKKYLAISRNLMTEGSSGCLRPKSIYRVMKEMQINQSSGFLDMGSGLGLPNVLVAIMYGLPSHKNIGLIESQST